MSTAHSKAAERFQQNRKKADWHDETFWGMRQKRDRMMHGIPEWEQLRQASHELKQYCASHLADLAEEFERNAVKNGAIVHWAKDAAEYNQIIHEILASHKVEHFIKSKSMLSEECGLREYLSERGIEAVESDLGERILQLMDLAPSHIVVPALGVTKEEVGECFTRTMDAEPGNCDQTYLTHVARRNLRQYFMRAQASMTGANFAVAATGEVVVCTNEGNADMGTSFGKIQIAAFGLDKLIPDYEALSVFHRLLARSGTGQPSTTYTAHYSRPQRDGELHVIIVDNGRSDILANEEHKKSLYCLRCGACMNTCPVYRRSGGYSYSYFIPGPIGINLGMLKDPAAHQGNLSACSLCHSCQNVCPAKIDLADQIYAWRNQMGREGKGSTQKKVMSKGMKVLFENPKVFNMAANAAHLMHLVPDALLYSKLNEWGLEHDMMEFPKESFNTLWKKGKIKK